MEELHNPDDTYRCIVNLNVNLLNRLYSDRFEWSLLHPPGLAEEFAKHTCADLGLGGEWVSAVAHAIYEAVLRLKKDVCENGGVILSYNEIDNDAAHGAEAGWRYDPEHLADKWEPTVEVLSKEEIEKREGDRERQLRRVRRETARYSSTANMGQPQVDMFNSFQDQDQPMGRGERSKKKRRFRSLSPVGRDTPDATVSGYGGGVALTEELVFEEFVFGRHANEVTGKDVLGGVHIVIFGVLLYGQCGMDLRGLRYVFAHDYRPSKRIR